MSVHDFEPTHFHVTIGPHEPVLRVASGDTIRTWCVDSGGFDRNGEEITEGGNPQTGPFYVESAEPGDTLSVRLDRIRPNRARGVTGGLVALDVVDPGFVPATTELLCLLREDYGLDYAAGSTLLGHCIRYDVGNVFDPAYTIVAKIEKALLERL